MRISVAVASAAAVAVLAAGCNGGGNSSGQNAENNTSRQDLSTFEQVQPAPHFSYSEIRQAAIDVEASQALGEQTTSFFFNLGVRNPIFSCPSIGDPIPNTAELTNPQQVENDGYPQGGAAVPIGNIDPNGLYAPSSSSGTNVMCLNATGDKYLQYWEGDVDTVNGAARWDSASGQIVVTGQPQMPSCTVGKSGKNNVTTCKK
jgi:hypothetical protein